jgi:hypothetical protein
MSASHRYQTGWNGWLACHCLPGAPRQVNVPPPMSDGHPHVSGTSPVPMDDATVRATVR